MSARSRGDSAELRAGDLDAVDDQVLDRAATRLGGGVGQRHTNDWSATQTFAANAVLNNTNYLLFNGGSDTRAFPLSSRLRALRGPRWVQADP